MPGPYRMYRRSGRTDSFGVHCEGTALPTITSQRRCPMFWDCTVGIARGQSAFGGTDARVGTDQGADHGASLQ